MTESDSIPNEIDEALRSYGYDPDEVGKRMAKVAHDAIERVKHERLDRFVQYLEDWDILQRRVKNHPYRVKKTLYE